MKTQLLALALLAGVANAESFRPIPTLAANIDDGQKLLPTIMNNSAPDPQASCPGYVAKHVRTTKAGVDARLYLAGEACNVYGTDIQLLQLRVQYQTKDRLNIQIYPANIPEGQESWYKVDESQIPRPLDRHPVGPAGSDWLFSYTASPFSFTVRRKSTGDIVFSTKGTKLVFENQFVEWKTTLPENSNIYGLGDAITDTFRLQGLNRTIYAADIGDNQDANLYGAHPFYLDHRYVKKDGATKGYAHGVYSRNFHGQDILVREGGITWRTIGGSIDLYFFSGPTPAEVTKSYVTEIGLPALQQYWTLGFHQCRWGYANISEIDGVVKSYKKFNIPLETIWSDIDYMDQYRDWTLDQHTYPAKEFKAWLDDLHSKHLHYVPIVDAAIYIPNPSNGSETYPSYDRGHELDVFLKNPDGSEYIGAVWPGYTVFPDWSAPNIQKWWDDEYLLWYKEVPFDGLWLDMNEVSSFCVGSCGTGKTNENPVHPFFRLPGERGSVIYGYPEGFDKTNSTEAAAASSASKSQDAWNSMQNPPSTSTKPYYQIPAVTPDVRNINYPPYAINNYQGDHDLAVHAVAPNATHHDGTSEYDVHSLWGALELRATYDTLLKVIPGKRPFIIGRSTAPGSGSYAGHWGGDNTSVFYYLRKSIQQALTFGLFGIPFFGVDTCGFAGNTDLELCSRWMQLSAFFTFYRNHNVLSANSQEAYVWADVASASRTAMNIRYSLLPYFYTLLYHAHTTGSTVLRALSWEFPDDVNLIGNDAQFMVGSGLMVLPVLEQGVSKVNGWFPTDGKTVWYDWYTGAATFSDGKNHTVDAPLGHIPVYVRGGNVLPLQLPSLTIYESRQNPFEVLVALDKNGEASGDLYIDDGESVNVKDSVYVSVNVTKKGATIKVTAKGKLDSKYLTSLKTIYVLGVAAEPKTVTIGGKTSEHKYDTTTKKLTVTPPSGLIFKAGSWEVNWA